MKHNWLLFLVIGCSIIVGYIAWMALQKQVETPVSIDGSLETSVEVSVKVVSAVTTSTGVFTFIPTTSGIGTPTVTSTSLPSTVTMTSSPTLTPIPTLNSVEEEVIVQELMATNGGCQLPCWWGFQLGENLGDIGERFTNLGIGPWRVSVSDFSNDAKRGYIKSGYFDPVISSYDIGISIDFYTITDTVQFIEITVERPLPQYGQEILLRDWERYSLSFILQEYGKPPYVYLVTQNVADSGSPNYILILYYPELGFKFSYQPYETSSNDAQPELCLNLENMQQINLSLYNPEFVDVWIDYLLPPALNPGAEDYLDQWAWETQIAIDLDTFYQTYQDPNNFGCVQVDN